MIHTRILALLDAAGVTARVHVHAPVRTADDARVLVPELARHLIKTIAFEIAGSPRIVLASVAADAAVDYKRLAVVCGCGRRDLQLLPPARVERELGVEVGGLGPFALAPTHAVVLDGAVLAQPRVHCGGGLRTHTLELAAADLVRASGAQVAAIARRPHPGD